MTRRPTLRLRLRWTASVLALMALACAAQAQDLRDPTRAPALPSASAAGQDGPALPISGDSTTVVMREGKPYLVVGTRLVGVGQTLGEFRLDRITETEIWLRQGKALHKVSRFGRVQRTAAVQCAPTHVKPASAKSAARKQNAKASNGGSAAGSQATRTAPAATSSNAAPCESSPP